MGLCSRLCIFLATRKFMRDLRLSDARSIISHVSCLSKNSCAPNLLANLPTRYRSTSPTKSPNKESIYTIPNEKKPCAAINAETKLMIGHSANIKQNIITYLYLMSKTIVASIAIYAE